MVVHNPNNWHWVDKNCLPWSKQYFQDELVDVSHEANDFKFIVTGIDSITGDCDVTQRKGKVLCIYDLSLQFSVSVSQGEDTYSGTINVPEFIHDQEEDEYVFDVTSGTHASEIKTLFVPFLKSKLMKFQDDLLKAHEKDVQHST